MALKKKFVDIMLGREGNGIKILCKLNVGHFEEKNRDRTGAYQLNDSGEGGGIFSYAQIQFGGEPK